MTKEHWTNEHWTNEHWKEEPYSQDFPAADSYPSLPVGPGAANRPPRRYDTSMMLRATRPRTSCAQRASRSCREAKPGLWQLRSLAALEEEVGARRQVGGQAPPVLPA
jgi:hypothetical protein